MLDNDDNPGTDAEFDYLATMIAPVPDLRLGLLGAEGRTVAAAQALAAGDRATAGRELHLLALQALRLALTTGAAAEALDLHAEAMAPEPLQAALGALRAEGEG